MEGLWYGRLSRHALSLAILAGVIAAALTVLAFANATRADAASGTISGKKNGQARNTEADYTPGENFDPLASSAECTPVLNDPFLLPEGYAQQVVAQEGEGGTEDLWDMNTQNEFGKDAGRYVYRTHETSTGAEVSVTDLKEGDTHVLAQRADWERFDGIVWTPWGSILAGEEVSDDAVDDPNFPEAKAGLVYEIFVDKNDPSKLDTDNPRDNVAPYDDGIAVRPALGSKSHEGMRFDKQGNYYGIHESDPGSIYRFVPDRKGDLSEGQLQALKTANHHTGRGVWVNLPDGAARIDAQAAANAAGANAYNRPEDVETGESTGRDSNNGGNTLYVAVTGTDEVLAVDLSSKKHPFAYDYVGHTAHNAPSSESATGGEFDYPDNLALDGKGNLAITEDPPTNPVGADIWVAEPPQQGRHHPAAEVARFASLKDCLAEPTGIYFALKGTERYTEGTSREDLVNDESLFVDRQHAGLGTTLDQLVSISPEGTN